ncbi:MAG: hypothetical protein J7500_06805 [Sphingomonas sp.]|uniref:hypothetical protein n=1 Tax=Sphingomonas sp. TaxID=28214 RepID=UPI001B1471F3|nr:hypothetical protein [Sphingomonas sp.]MBO9622403.1 hypothetical protein [Sphingomonas sp.]
MLELVFLPVLMLLSFAASLAAGSIYAALVMAAEHLLHLEFSRAKILTTLAWHIASPAALWAGANHLSTGQIDDFGIFFSAIMIWIFVVLPAPFAGNWIISTRRNRKEA